MIGKKLRFLFSIGLVFLATCAQTGVSENYASNSVQMSYSLFVGDDIDQSHSISIGVPKKSTFYEAMGLAAAENPIFEFSAIEFTGLGHYITTIAGVTEDKVENNYWMIYILDEPPNSDSPPSDDLLSPVGVDKIIVREDKYYLFWYKNVVWD